MYFDMRISKAWRERNKREEGGKRERRRKREEERERERRTRNLSRR